MGLKKYYSDTCMGHFVCPDCKLGIKSNYKTFTCVKCKQPMFHMSTKFRIPKKNSKEWKKLSIKIKCGEMFR
jgi:hypothetical protein